MDILKELTLRRWAREHYVAPSLRDPSWDPAVLDEMRLRDQEIAEEELIAAATQLVPLAPVTCFLEGPHPGPPSPHFLTKPVRESVGGLPEWGLFIG
jgi:hypothetical protein